MTAKQIRHLELPELQDLVKQILERATGCYMIRISTHSNRADRSFCLVCRGSDDLLCLHIVPHIPGRSELVSYPPKDGFPAELIQKLAIVLRNDRSSSATPPAVSAYNEVELVDPYSDDQAIGLAYAALAFVNELSHKGSSEKESTDAEILRFLLLDLIGNINAHHGLTIALI